MYHSAFNNGQNILHKINASEALSLQTMHTQVHYVVNKLYWETYTNPFIKSVLNICNLSARSNSSFCGCLVFGTCASYGFVHHSNANSDAILLCVLAI